MVLEFIFGIQSSIMRALAMQWRLGVSITCVLWFVLLPAIFVVAIQNNGGLVSQWALMPVGYSILQVAMRLAYHNVDWTQKSFEVRQQMESRSGTFGENEASEKSLLLSQHGESSAV